MMIFDFSFENNAILTQSIQLKPNDNDDENTKYMNKMNKILGDAIPVCLFV